MKMSELQQKNNADLSKYVTEKRAELQKLHFGVAGSGMRNTRAMRNLRKEIAQALTEITARAHKEA